MKGTHYDESVDALSIDLRARAKSARTVRVTDEVRVDFDADGRAVSIEILNASRHVDPSVLESAQAGGELLSLVEASERSGRSAETLRGQIHKGRIEGEKRGRDWFVSAASLENYMEVVEAGRSAQAPRKRSPARRKLARKAS